VIAREQPARLGRQLLAVRGQRDVGSTRVLPGQGPGRLTMA
jgi:hypothetical protein